MNFRVDHAGLKLNHSMALNAKSKFNISKISCASYFGFEVKEFYFLRVQKLSCLIEP